MLTSATTAEQRLSTRQIPNAANSFSGKRSRITRRTVARDREEKLLQLRLRGETRKEIARELDCSLGAVDLAIRRLKDRWGCVTLEQVVAKWVTQKVL